MTPRLHSAWRRYLGFFGARPERDVDDELAFHVQARIDEYIASGMTFQHSGIRSLEFT